MQILLIQSWKGLLTGSIVGIVVVFVALSVLLLAFYLMKTVIVRSSRKKRAVRGNASEPVRDIQANEIAAISLALHLYMNDIHDEESNVITIKRIERRYSPWNSKIYGLNNVGR